MILSKFKFEKYGDSIRSLAAEYDKVCGEKGSASRCIEEIFGTVLSEHQCREVAAWLNGVVFDAKCAKAEWDNI